MEKFLINSKEIDINIGMSYNPKKKIVMIGCNKKGLWFLTKLVHKYMGFTKEDTIQQGLRQVNRYRYYLSVKDDVDFRSRMNKALNRVEFMPIETGISKIS